MRLIGLEPTTPTMSRWCSNQLSYKRFMVRSIGLEPTTPTMSRWCSNQLSYERNVVVTTGTHISDRERLWQEANVTFLAEQTRLRKFYSCCLYFADDQGYFLPIFPRKALATGHEERFDPPGVAPVDGRARYRKSVADAKGDAADSRRRLTILPGENRKKTRACFMRYLLVKCI